MAKGVLEIEREAVTQGSADIQHAERLSHSVYSLKQYALHGN